jgi:hypothetical protein
MTSKTPDKPFDFNLDAVKAEVDLTPFVVQFAGERWSFAHIQDISVWPILEGVGGGDLATIQATLQAALGAQAWTKFKTKHLPQHKMIALFNAYEKHCGASAGESPASSDS